MSFQKLPSITLCNYNMLKWHVVKSSPVFADINKLMDQYEAIHHKNETSPDDFGFRVRITTLALKSL